MPPSKPIRTETCPKCRKGIYRSERSIIREILFRSRNGSPPLRYYRCPRDPKTFHITSQTTKAPHPKR